MRLKQKKRLILCDELLVYNQGAGSYWLPPPSSLAWRFYSHGCKLSSAPLDIHLSRQRMRYKACQSGFILLKFFTRSSTHGFWLTSHWLELSHMVSSTVKEVWGLIFVFSAFIRNPRRVWGKIRHLVTALLIISLAK